MVLGAIVSVQSGTALATSLFAEVGAAGTVLSRSCFGAALLLLLTRPPVRSFDRAQLRDVALFAVALAGMNLSFYEALARLPLGVAVTLEFVGPLTMAVLGSRRRRDALWAVLAGVGIFLLSGGYGGTAPDGFGVLLALSGGAFWAAYILLSARVGRHDAGLGVLGLAMAVSALLVAPLGLVEGGADLLDPTVLAIGMTVGLLSSAIPYGLELQALRRLPSAVFGVLMSLEPAFAALIGFVALSQQLSAIEVSGIAIVVAASAGALCSTRLRLPLSGPSPTAR